MIFTYKIVQRTSAFVYKIYILVKRKMPAIISYVVATNKHDEGDYETNWNGPSHF